MRRREFITLLGGAAVCSSVAGAQTARKRPVIGTFIQGTPTQNKGLRFRQSFLDGLRELGDIEGRDFDIMIQPARSTSELPKAAEHLVQLNPGLEHGGSIPLAEVHPRSRYVARVPRADICSAANLEPTRSARRQRRIVQSARRGRVPSRS